MPFVGEFKHISNMVAEPGHPSRYYVRLRDLRNEAIVKPSPTGYRVLKSHFALEDMARIYEDGFFGTLMRNLGVRSDRDFPRIL